MSVGSLYLQVVAGNLHGLKKQGEKAMAQLTPEQLFVKLEPDGNNIAILVQHLSGNMLSRWTDFLTTDGEKPDRDRDREFEDVAQTKEELLAQWEKGWDCLFQAVKKLTDDDLEKTVYIRAEPHTVIKAIQRQIVHYAMHVGEILQIARTLLGADWQTLSVPKGKSKEYRPPGI
jgi:hypothetical protein